MCILECVYVCIMDLPFLLNYLLSYLRAIKKCLLHIHDVIGDVERKKERKTCTCVYNLKFLFIV